VFETARRDGTLQVRADASWLATGPDGGYRRAPAAYNVTVPEGFDRTDLAGYAAERRERAGFDRPGPTLLTGVAQRHARGARSGPVVAVATVGLSNPAALPMDPGGSASREDAGDGNPSGPGTVNLLVGTERRLADGALATLLATAVEAKTATLLATTGFPGTTTDAAVVGADPAGDAAAFAGSETTVGSATRACVREAVRASLAARYGDASPPATVDDADHGTTTTDVATVFEPGSL